MDEIKYIKPMIRKNTIARVISLSCINLSLASIFVKKLGLMIKNNPIIKGVAFPTKFI